MSDESKVIEEIAKTTGKAIDAGRELAGFLSKYVGGSVREAMGIAEDKLKYMRWERQIRLIERASSFLAERGLQNPTRTVRLQIAIPLIQGASLEEDDWLQDRWAVLLVNAADAAFHTEVRRAFISILEELTPLDASLLEKIYSTSQIPSMEAEIWTTHLPTLISEQQPDKEIVRPPSDVEVSLGNLARLGLITSALVWGPSLSCVRRTMLGCEFLKAISSGHSDV